LGLLSPRDPKPESVLREQLRLFAIDGRNRSPSDVLITPVRQGLSKRERPAILLEGEVNSSGQDSSYASHDLYAFAEKFPPQLPRVFMRSLTEPGDLALDSMIGSGTVIVEALLEGRQGVGFDIDPLALRLSQM